jgi:hypothetical protein
VHAPLSHTWSGLQAWATGAPIIADTANSVPTAAKSAVMVRDVGRISRLFALLESAIRFPLPFWLPSDELPVISFSAVSWRKALVSHYVNFPNEVRNWTGRSAYGCRPPPPWWPRVQPATTPRRVAGRPRVQVRRNGRTCPLPDEHELAPDLVRRIRTAIGPPHVAEGWRAEH